MGYVIIPVRYVESLTLARLSNGIVLNIRASPFIRFFNNHIPFFFFFTSSAHQIRFFLFFSFYFASAHSLGAIDDDIVVSDTRRKGVSFAHLSFISRPPTTASLVP